MARRRRLAQALTSAALDVATGGIGSLAMQVGRDAVPANQRGLIAPPEEQSFVAAVESLARTRGRERTCFLLTQALHDLMDDD